MNAVDNYECPRCGGGGEISVSSHRYLEPINSDGAVQDCPDCDGTGCVKDEIAGFGFPCTLGVGCDESGFCYALAHNRPEMCGALEQSNG